MVSSLDKLTRKLKNNLLDIERSANRDGKGLKSNEVSNMPNITSINLENLNKKMNGTN